MVKQFDAQLWDKQIEEDIKTGKLDKLAQEALANFETNQCTTIQQMAEVMIKPDL